jgi:hypothetical protein
MKSNFDEIWERIRKETDLKTLAELGQVVEKKQQTISYSKSKNEFSPAWAYIVGKKYGLLTEWIMTGKGPKRIEDATVYRKFDILNEVEEWLTEEVKNNPRRESWFELQMLDNFESFKKWKIKRDEAEGGESKFPTSKVA